VWFLQALARLPLPLLHALAVPLGFSLQVLLRYRRHVVDDNLAAAFPQAPVTELNALRRGFYRHLATTVLEIVAAARMPPDALVRRVAVPELGLISTPLASGTPMLLLSLHQGNWEWMVHSLSARLGTPIDVVYKPLHNATLDRFMVAVRTRFGGRALPLRAAARAVLRAEAPHRPLAMLADQSPIEREGGQWERFMGRETPFFEGAEKLARRSGAIVIFGQSVRIRPGYYEVRLTRLAAPPYDDLPAGAITTAYVNACEQAIRAQPATYLWSNRRWKRTR
jgi:Kdo2-lipid IVA lauroyltransferase/acyltransferase